MCNALFYNVNNCCGLHAINKYKWDVAIVGLARTANLQVVRVTVDAAPVDATE